MPVTLVAVLYNSGDALHRFMTSLLAQDMPRWRLIAIDNASTDQSAQFVANVEDPRVSLLRNDANLGFARAVNRGLREAARDPDAEFFILINTDTEFEPDFLRRFLDARRCFGSEVLVPRIMNLNRPGYAWYAGGHFKRDWVLQNVHDAYDEGETVDMKEVEFASGCCLGLSRRTLEAVGLLDESFFVYWEDADYCLRLAANGIPIHYVNSPILYHEGGVSSGGEFSPSYLRLYYRNHMLLIRKHQGWVSALCALVRLFMVELRKPKVSLRALWIIIAAMTRGLLTPLRPEPRL